jgi:hypothetical protein
MDLSKSYEYFQPDTVREPLNIVGCGSVGATVAEHLVRLGLTNITLWDMDVVDPHNLTNQIFRHKDIGHPKVEALADILTDINPDIKDKLKLYPKGWSGQQLSGYVFLCVDNIELRRQIVEKHMNNPYIKAMFDFRTRLEDAQHYAADWRDRDMKKNLLSSMEFSHEEAMEETPVSACGVTLGVVTTVRAICALGVINFISFVRGHGIRKLINFDAPHYLLDAF